MIISVRTPETRWLALVAVSATPTESDLRSVLESMGYQLEMLIGLTLVRQSIRGIVVDGLDRSAAFVWTNNALLEAHCVHVRSLLEFFYVGTNKWITATSYVPNWKSKHRPDARVTLGEPAGPLYDDLNTKLSHLNRPRGEKRSWDTLPRLSQGLTETARGFDEFLDGPMSTALRSQAPHIGWVDK
jgi:hypothetical protein